MNIPLKIKELLYFHDCVILPGFGGFIANNINSKIPATNIFSPPAKVIAFNRNIRNDDGLLANHIGTKEKLSYSVTRKIINDFVFDINKELEFSKDVNFEGIGKFRLDKNSILQFEPYKGSNFLLDSFGLTSFYFPKVKIDNGNEKSMIYFKDIESVRPVVRLLHFKKIIAVFIVIILLSFIPANLEIFRNIKVNLSSVFSSANKVNALFENKNYSPEKKTISRNESKKNFINHVPVKEKLSPIPPVNDNSSKITIQNLDYAVIAGCFKIRKNADNQIRLLSEKGLIPSIMDKYHGLYRVSIGTFDNETEALELIKKVNRDQPELTVWFLKK